MRKALMVISPGDQTPLATLTADGKARWDDRHTFLLDGVTLFEAVRDLLATLPEGHRAVGSVTYSTDGFVTGQWSGDVQYRAPYPGEDPEDYSYCGDGCCMPDSPSKESLRVGGVDLSTVIEERDDVRTTVEIDLIAVAPNTAQVTLAHPWEGNPPGATITVTEAQARSLDRSGRLKRT